MLVHRKILIGLIVLTCSAFVLDIMLGSVSIPLKDAILSVFGGSPSKASWSTIIWEFRLPKALTTIIVGSGLAVSGLLMQTLFRNPLAGPFVLGISSGASLGVAILIMAGSLFGFSIFSLSGSSWAIVLSAVAGAMLVFGLVMIVANKIRDSMSLLIVGLMFGTATGAVVGVLQYFSEAKDIQAFLIWTFGSLGGLGWDKIGILSSLCLTAIALAFVLFKPLNALLLGDNYAQSMGVPIKQMRLLIVAATSILAGSITAFCGPIAFIGIAVPHIARALLGTSDHKVLLPATVLIGSSLLLVCDIIAQLPGSQHVLPINAVTSFVGAPIVIWVIISKRGYTRSF